MLPDKLSNRVRFLLPEGYDAALIASDQLLQCTCHRPRGQDERRR